MHIHRARTVQKARTFYRANLSGRFDKYDKDGENFNVFIGRLSTNKTRRIILSLVID